MQRSDHQWTIASLPWDRFDAPKIDPDMLKVIKAASVVEYGARDYAAYLRKVFAGDIAFQQAVDGWAKEEIRHGEALGNGPNAPIRLSIFKRR